MDPIEKDKKYNRWAREIPTYICIAFPFSFFLLVLYESDKNVQNSIQWFITKVIMWGAAIFPALFFLLRMFIRDFSSFIADNILFQWYCKYYIWPRYMYRVLLKEGCGISKSSFDIIKDELKKSGFDILCKDKSERKLVIKDAISHIKNSTREDSIVFEYNIFYGFYRNTAGGLLLVNILFYIFSLANLPITKGLGDAMSIIQYAIWILFAICIIFMYYNDYKYALKMIRLYLKTNLKK